MQNPFPGSVPTIAELTGVSVTKRCLEEILPDAARDFDAFYQQRSMATAAGSVLVPAVDGKDILHGQASPTIRAFWLWTAIGFTRPSEGFDPEPRANFGEGGVRCRHKVICDLQNITG